MSCMLVACGLWIVDTGRQGVTPRLESPRPFEAEAMGSGTGYAIAAETAFLTVDPCGLIQIDLAGFDHPWQS